MDALATNRPSIADDLRLTPQARSVLGYMKRRKDASITPMKALVVMGVYRLASCIHEIRTKAGYQVRTLIERDEAGHRYSRYTLVVH
jgi:hypothetical protein